MKSALRTIFFLSLGISGGCSWLVGEGEFFDDSAYDYTKAEITKEMQVPESVGESNIQDHFLVPELGDGVVGEIYGEEKEAYAPMQVLTLGNKVRPNRDSKDSSVYVTETEIRLWDLVERYLNTENIQISNKDLNTGSIITGWHESRDDSFWSGEITGWRYRYQIKLSSAQRPSENIVSVKILEAQEFVDDTGKWRNIINTKRTETEFLNSILGFMYVEDISTSRKLVSQSALGGITVTLGNDSKGNPALVTSASFEHVWTRIPISLSLLNIPVDDQDRSQGLYFITQGEEDKGFFASLAFWSGDDGDSLDIPDGAYRIMVAKKGDQVTMTFLDDGNNALDSSVLAKNFPLLSKAFRSRAKN